MSLFTVIIATESENNMNSKHSKYIMPVGGRPVINWVLNAVEKLNPDEVIIAADDSLHQIKECIGKPCIFADVPPKSGVLPALVCGTEIIAPENGDVLIIRGDIPLADSEVLKSAYLKHSAEGSAATYVSSNGSSDIGACVFDLKKLRSFLHGLTDEELKSDIASAFAKFSASVTAVGICPADSDFNLKVTDRISLANADRILNLQTAKRLMADGVTVLMPESVRISPDAKVGRDTVIYPGTILEGKVEIGEDCVIGPNTKISDSTIGCNTEIQSSVILESEIGDNTSVGPFAYVRPNSKIGNNIKVGDFVEVKNANIGNGTKIAHLTYVGDADVGERVNFGCGTVVVNYDGIHKHRTTIEDDCFIGCNTNLVSPVTVRRGAYTAAGSTITDEVPADALAIARSRQVVKDGWAKGKKK